MELDSYQGGKILKCFNFDLSFSFLKSVSYSPVFISKSHEHRQTSNPCVYSSVTCIANDTWKLKVTVLRKRMIQFAAWINSLLASGSLLDSYSIIFCSEIQQSNILNQPQLRFAPSARISSKGSWVLWYLYLSKSGTKYDFSEMELK